MSLVAELFEGDIIMDQRLRSWVTGQYDKRDAINDVSYMWPSLQDENGERVIRVPYTLSDEIKRGKRSSSLFSLVFKRNSWDGRSMVGTQVLCPLTERFFFPSYYTTSSMSGQDESNHAL